MEAKFDIQEFSSNNILHTILFNYILDHQFLIEGKPLGEISKGFIRKQIEMYGVKINGSSSRRPTERINEGDIIELSQFGIKFIAKKNATYVDNLPNTGCTKIEIPKMTEQVASEPPEISDIEKPGEPQPIDNIIEELLKNSFGVSLIGSVPHNEYKRLFCLILSLFQDRGFDIVYQSKYSYEFTNFLKVRINDSNLAKELDFSKQQLSSSGMLIEKLLVAKGEKESELIQLINELINGQYNKTLFRFLQEYSKIINSSSFQFLIFPLLNQNLSSRVAVENLIKPINDASLKTEIEEKYIHYTNTKSNFENYCQNLILSDAYNKHFFQDLYNYLYKLFKENCDTSDEKAATIEIEPTLKKYNFKRIETQEQNLFLYICNSGEGLAKNLVIHSLSPYFPFDDVNVGILKPEERREVMLVSQINYNSDFTPILEVELTWEETSGKILQIKSEISFGIQDTNIPWDDLKKQNLYTIQIIEDKNKLYGRDEILEELKSNILSDNIVSYKIWGQKRVGKSSIVKTLKSILNDYENAIIVYRRIGGLRNPDPVKFLNDLGESLCSEIINEIDVKIKTPNIREQLKNIAVPSFDGSFYPLESFLSKLHRIEKSLKFVFILDEFDRINEEFFLPGNLGEVLSQNIGKGLNEERYIGFILVGSENMQILDRQGMNYNSYREREVDTFNKRTQYPSYKNIVIGPSAPYITFSEESIDKIFDITNGNPYFTNLICFNAFKNAYNNKDAFIDLHNTVLAIEQIVKSSQKGHFEHFWGDGLTEEGDTKKERKTDIRRRILVSYNISCRIDSNHYPSKIEILKNFKYPTEYKIESYEVENIITEFFNRKIFYNINSTIRIKPQIFESWLLGPGKSLMIEGVSDLEAQHREKELEQLYSLKDDELKRLSETLIFENRKITLEKYKSYFNQFGDSIQQRRIFNLVDSIYYIPHEEIVEFFRIEQRNIFPKQIIELKEGAKTVFREGIQIYSFSKMTEENEPIIDSFKFMSRIRSKKTVKNTQEDKDFWKKNNSTEIIIIEPIIDEPLIIHSELRNFINNGLNGTDIPIRLITLVITTKAKTSLIRLTASIPNFKLIILREVDETKIKPFIHGTELFENDEEATLVFAEVKKTFPKTKKDSLLVLMGQVCPSKTCPILWCKTNQFEPVFLNLYGNYDNQESLSEKEELRLRVYKANRILSQNLNSYIVNRLKDRAESDVKEWFSVKYIPKGVLEAISSKWIQEGQVAPKESYFDFMDYKKIISMDPYLSKIFTLPGEDLSWCDKLNVLRRDPAHPEKPAPKLDDVEYFEKITNRVMDRIIQN